MDFFAILAGLPVPIGVVHPVVAKIVAYHLSPAFVAPVHFPVERAGGGASFLFCVVGIIKTGIGVCAVAIGTRMPPVVLARVCFPMRTPAIIAHGGRCAIRIPKVAAVFRLGVAGVARADVGVGFISVGHPSAPVMPQLGIRAALGAGGIVVAGRYAEGTILRFDVVAFMLAGAGVSASADGLPLAPVVRPVIAEAVSTVAAFCFPYARGFLSNPVILQELFLAVIAPPQMLIFVLF